jgi:tetratricopeptide (TPR) repeat protein
MMRGSLLSARTTETTPEEIGRESSGTKRRHAAATVVSAALACVATVATACGGGTGNSNSASGSANALISQGLRAESSGKTHQAISDFKAAAARNPVSPVAYYDLGVIYQQYLKESSQAASYYNKAILADSSYKPALYNLAILNTASNPLEAVSLYDQLLKMNPNDSNVLFNLGLLLINLGQNAQGEADVQKAVLINPALKSRVPPGVTP